MNRTILSALVFIAGLCHACKETPAKADDLTQTDSLADDSWYKALRQKIITESLKFDSTSIEPFEPDPSRQVTNYFLGDRKQKMEMPSTDSTGGLVILYSKDGKLELRKEICANGQVAFEGITYEDHFYGLSTWWHCNGQIREQGLRYRNKQIGSWKQWNEKGVLIKTTEHPDQHLLDSLRAMKL